ncbi:MAG: DinB family protein, partial [Ardenticatenaceae bacterium]
MNAIDILKYGHLTVLETIEGLPEERWLVPGVCGIWSVKEIIAHLASFEQLLVEVLDGFLGGGTTPVLDQLLAIGDEEFNTTQVGQRTALTVAETLGEYNDAHQQVMSRAVELPGDTLRQDGTL